MRWYGVFDPGTHAGSNRFAFMGVHGGQTGARFQVPSRWPSQRSVQDDARK